MVETVLGGTIAFLGQLGVYDVVLPFLLVFTLMFAFLEKTKVLGVEIITDKAGKDHTYTRKNLNSIVAFTTGFFVIASSQLVRIISEVIANTILIVVTALCFMLAIGVFHTGQEEMDIGKGWKKFFWVISFIAILLILFNAMGWLEGIYTFLMNNWSNTAVISVITILVFVGMMLWVTGTFSNERKSSTGDKKEQS